MNTRMERREALIAEAPTLLRDAYKIIETRALPDMHEQEMLQLFVSNNRTAAKTIGERFSISGAVLAEDLSYARAIVQNATFQAAAKHEYVLHPEANGKDQYVGAVTPQGYAALSDALNMPSAINVMTNLIRHIKKDPSCSRLSYREISVRAADSIYALSRSLSNRFEDQLKVFMEDVTVPGISWTKDMTEYDYKPDCLLVEKDGERIRLKPTKKFLERLEWSKRRRQIPWDKKDTAFCPMMRTKGSDDAYKLLLQSLQLALKKIEDTKVGRTNA